MFSLVLAFSRAAQTHSSRHISRIFNDDSDGDLVCFGKVCFPGSQEDVNNYGEPKGWGDSPPPYDRCTQYGCGH